MLACDLYGEVWYSSLSVDLGCVLVHHGSCSVYVLTSEFAGCKVSALLGGQIGDDIHETMCSSSIEL